MQKRESEETKKIRCEKCSSTFGYLKIKKKMFQCRSCGYLTEIKEE